MARWIFFSSLVLLAINAGLTMGFKAAVFEHAQQRYATPSKEPRDIVRNNLEYYTIATRLASSQGVKVIVFPEYGIIPDIGNRKKLKAFLENIPDPNVTTSNPCEESKSYSDRPILSTLSCLARDNRIIIVANMGDIQPCEGQKECPKDGAFHFNTNVVFDKNGKILAKYHKEHLFGEAGMDLPLREQDPTFETDLGRFSTFICFDIVFKRITEVARWKDVKAILFPTMWINSSPLFNSMQYFESWAIGNNVTLLAANVHLPGMSGIGSGIIKGREGTQVYTFNPDGNSKLLITDLTEDTSNATPKSVIFIVSKNGTREWTHDGINVGEECSSKVLKPVKNLYKDYRCLERDTANFTLVKLVKSSDRIEACSNGMCCVLGYSADEMLEDFYLGVYNGTFNALNRYFFAEENCFLARCDGMKNKACVTFPMRSKTLFHSIFMEANFSSPFIYPSVMNNGMRLMPTNQWKFSTNGRTASIYLENSSKQKILMVGLKSRAYNRDPPYVK